MNTLAMWLIEDGDLASAEPLVRGALEMRTKLLGPDHADVASSMTLLAGLLVETGATRKRWRWLGTPRLSGSRRWLPDTGARPARGGAKVRPWPGCGRYDEAEKLLLASYRRSS